MKISKKDIAYLETMQDQMKLFMEHMNSIDPRILEKVSANTGVRVEACAETLLTLTYIRSI